MSPSLVQPRKLTWNPKNDGVEHELFFQRCDFRKHPYGSMLVVEGVNALYLDWHLVILAGNEGPT